MFSPIPLPNPNDNHQFKDVMDFFVAMQLRKMQKEQFEEEMKYKGPLSTAQTAEANAKAYQAQMLANLMGQDIGVGTGALAGQPNKSSGPYIEYGANNKASPEEVEAIGNNAVNNLMTSGNDMGQTSSSSNSLGPDARNKLISWGVLKENPSEQEARETRTAYAKELAASDIKIMDKWNETLTTNSQVIPVLENIQQISASPEFKSIYTNPEYFGYDISYLKRFGTPEEQKVITDLGSNAKSIYQGLGQEFKGAFREFEKKLFDKAVPDEINDTPQQIVSKTNTMLALRNLVSKRLTVASDIVRSSGGKISPSQALTLADKKINSKDVVKKIEDDFTRSQLEQETAKKKRSEQSSNKNTSNSQVGIYSSDGKLVARGSKESADKFLKDHPGYSQKVLTNGQ